MERWGGGQKPALLHPMCSGRGEPHWIYTGGCCSEDPVRTGEGAGEEDVDKSLKLITHVKLMRPYSAGGGRCHREQSGGGHLWVPPEACSSVCYCRGWLQQIIRARALPAHSPDPHDRCGVGREGVVTSTSQVRKGRLRESR